MSHRVSAALIIAAATLLNACGADPSPESTGATEPSTPATAPPPTAQPTQPPTPPASQPTQPVDPAFGPLVDFAGDDPLSLVAQGWALAQRRHTTYGFADPACPPQETYAALAGAPAIVDTYASPLADGMEVAVTLIELADAAARSELVAAALNEIPDCPIDPTLGLDGGVAIVEEPGVGGYYGDHHGFIVVAPDAGVVDDAAPFVALLAPSGDTLPQAVIEHLVAAARAALVPSEPAPAPPPHLGGESIELGADPLGLVAAGWTLRSREAERLSIESRMQDCLEWTEFDGLDGVTYLEDWLSSPSTNEWDLSVGFWDLDAEGSRALVDGSARLVRCPTIEDAALERDVFTVVLDGGLADGGWAVGGYLVDGRSARVAIARSDGRSVTLWASRVGLTVEHVDDLVGAAVAFLDDLAPEPSLRYETPQLGVSSARLDGLLPDPLGLLAEGFEGGSSPSEFDLRWMPPDMCDGSDAVADLGRLPSISGSFWWPEPGDLGNLSVGLDVFDIGSGDDPEGDATLFWERAPDLFVCTMTMTAGSSDTDVAIRAIDDDVIAVVFDDVAHMHWILGSGGLVARLQVDAETVDQTLVDDLLDRTRALLES